MIISSRRLIRSIGWVQLFTAILAVILACLHSEGSAPNPSHNLNTIMSLSPYFLLVLLAIIVAAFHTWVQYTKDWYKPDLALKYQDLLDGDHACDARAAAAKQFKTSKKYDQTTKEVEIVLDILEDIGFYVKHDEISIEVAHHHFYHWIRGYIQTADGYIAEYRREDPLAYEHCKFLLEAVSAFEAKKIKREAAELHWNENDINEFLEEEAGMSNRV
jgi:hypothetical protein